MGILHGLWAHGAFGTDTSGSFDLYDSRTHGLMCLWKPPSLFARLRAVQACSTKLYFVLEPVESALARALLEALLPNCAAGVVRPGPPNSH